MIHKVYIVRCSYCHASLYDSFGLARPKYFYNLDSIPETLSKEGWKVIQGVEVCRSCLQKQHNSEL